jgi:hypothetical protein
MFGSHVNIVVAWLNASKTEERRSIQKSKDVFYRAIEARDMVGLMKHPLPVCAKISAQIMSVNARMTANKWLRLIS